MNRVLAVLVNYGDEQLDYLAQVVAQLKAFEHYDVTVIVNSNVALDITGIDRVQIFELDNYQYLPLTCRQTLWDNRDAYDIFIYGENDHLFLEQHVDKHLEYTRILPKNRIAGLIQYEESPEGRFYPGYHIPFEWDYRSVKRYGGKTFAHFNNIHQASFILTQAQLLRIGKRLDFVALAPDKRYNIVQKAFRKFLKLLGVRVPVYGNYSLKCKVNTDIFQYAGLKKLICISEFEANLIHHLPNLYISGTAGRQQLGSSESRMQEAIQRLMKTR
ncbi:hypothetical protein C1T31_13470 [Hanstruepera neustonica]|uniref:Glycosyltransferase family 2 protein n=1 Tax=Hanstruepera neustonica TaxID=1445657 RepID=A0A2K1DVN2_9FLAO|nr:hypothetical protein [Hanstruepera neustonica]PNQ72108.1 hypothetical protein C1T31_13470 [Hanstruepera neustonica]